MSEVSKILVDETWSTKFKPTLFRPIRYWILPNDFATNLKVKGIKSYLSAGTDIYDAIVQQIEETWISKYIVASVRGRNTIIRVYVINKDFPRCLRSYSDQTGPASLFTKCLYSFSLQKCPVTLGQYCIEWTHVQLPTTVKKRCQSIWNFNMTPKSIV